MKLNCINTVVAKIFRVSFGNNISFIRQMAGLANFRIKTFKFFFQQSASESSVKIQSDTKPFESHHLPLE